MRVADAAVAGHAAADLDQVAHRQLRHAVKPSNTVGNWPVLTVLMVWPNTLSVPAAPSTAPTVPTSAKLTSRFCSTPSFSVACTRMPVCRSPSVAAVRASGRLENATLAWLSS
jgi:hypothetical protein